MQYADNVDSALFDAIENVVLVYLELAVPITDVVASDSDLWIGLNGLHARFELIEIRIGLLQSKVFIGVKPDVLQVAACLYPRAKFIHDLAYSRFTLRFSTDRCHIQCTGVATFFTVP